MIRIIVMAKAPVPGNVKTRLMPDYSAEEACQLHALMTKTVLNKALSVCDDVWLATDEPEHEEIKDFAARFDIRVYNQGAEGLGERLTRLMRISFATDASKLMFLGADSPHIDPQRYRDAFHALRECDVVIGPVEDGGYDLIAINSPLTCLFESVSWGSEQVLEQTMAVCEQYALAVTLLERSFDLDTAEDLLRAPPHTW